MRDLQLEELGIESKDVVDMDELLSAEETSTEEVTEMPEDDDDTIDEDDDEDDEDDEISDEGDEPDAEITDK